MARLTPAERSALPDRAFAYVDSRRQRRLPIHDQSHVRNALARFDQVKYESDAARETARRRLLRAAKKHGIMPVGFIERQLQSARATTLSTWEPTGPVTLLFTDIEGSTPLLRRLGDAYEDALDTMRSIISDCVRSANGHEIEVRADETFSIFETAEDGIHAAIEMQRRFEASMWPNDERVRIRAGLHTGSIRSTSNDYIGLAIHEAHRVSSFAKGGQVVCSSTMRTAARKAGVSGDDFRSLGKHELAGLESARTLFQLSAEG